jgi:Na+/H+-dicarboxylate symporter
LTVVFNLGSSALYVACAAIFVSEVLHADISGWNIAIIYFTTVLTGLGTTGIPNAGFIGTMTVLRTISLPTSAVAILFPIDAVLSRVRTAVNIWGHLVCTQCVDLWIHKKSKGNIKDAK